MEQKLKDDLKSAQLARDELRVSTLRLIISEITNSRISKGVESLSDEEVTTVLQKEAKKRKESVESYKAGGREDLAQKEESELAIIKTYIPEELSNEELTKIVEETIKELGATSMSDMGKVMGKVTGITKGRADGGVVSALVREKLS